MCLSPDGDIEIVDFLVTKTSEIDQVRMFRADRTLLRIATENVYRWEDNTGELLDDDTLQEYVTEGEAIAAAARGDKEPLLAAPAGGDGLLAAALRRDLGQTLVAPGASDLAKYLPDRREQGRPPPPGLSLAGAAQDGGLLAAALARVPGGAAPLSQWLAVETVGGTHAGAVVRDELVTTSVGDRGIAELASGEHIFVRKYVNSGASVSPVVEAGRSDFRVLPVTLDYNQKRYGDARLLLDRFRSHRPSDWPVAGPQTCVWLVRFMISRAGSCVGYHERWLAEVKLDYSAAGTVEHQGWCRVLDTAIGYDFLDLGALASMEIGARRIQMIHDKWKHKLPQYQGADGAEDLHLLLGTGETRGNLAMAPELVRWLGEQLSQEAVAAKERRKAREERALAAAKK